MLDPLEANLNSIDNFRAANVTPQNVKVHLPLCSGKLPHTGSSDRVLQQIPRTSAGQRVSGSAVLCPRAEGAMLG
jgi:hypothetical protein